jgi:hypothetical protein
MNTSDALALMVANPPIGAFYIRNTNWRDPADGYQIM